jgi:hypothetical protein
MGAHGFLGEAILLFLVLFLPGYLSQPAAASATPVDTVRAMLQSVIFGVPQVLLMLHLLRLQHEVPLEHFGLYRLRVRDALRAAGAFLGSLALAAPFVAGMAWLHSELGAGVPLEPPLGLGVPLARLRPTRATASCIPRTCSAASAGRIPGPGVAASRRSSPSTSTGVLGVALALLGLYLLVYLRAEAARAAVAHGLFNAALLA